MTGIHGDDAGGDAKHRALGWVRLLHGALLREKIFLIARRRVDEDIAVALEAVAAGARTETGDERAGQVLDLLQAELLWGRLR